MNKKVVYIYLKYKIKVNITYNILFYLYMYYISILLHINTVISLIFIIKRISEKLISHGCNTSILLSNFMKSNLRLIGYFMTKFYRYYNL